MKRGHEMSPKVLTPAKPYQTKQIRKIVIIAASAVALASCGSGRQVSSDSQSQSQDQSQSEQSSSLSSLTPEDPATVYDAFISASKKALSAPNVTVDATFNTIDVVSHLDKDGAGTTLFETDFSAPGMTVKGSVANKTNGTCIGKKAAFDFQAKPYLKEKGWQYVERPDSSGSGLHGSYEYYDSDYYIGDEVSSPKAYFEDGSMFLDFSERNEKTWRGAYEIIYDFESCLLANYESTLHTFEPGKYGYPDWMAKVDNAWDENLSEKLSTIKQKDAYANWFSGTENGASAYKARVIMTGSQIRNAIKSDSEGVSPSLPWIADLIGKPLREKATISDESALTLEIDYSAEAISKIAWDAKIVGDFTSNVDGKKGSFSVNSTGNVALDFATVPAITYPDDMYGWSTSNTYSALI
jgi:hypothetical protein